MSINGQYQDVVDYVSQFLMVQDIARETRTMETACAEAMEIGWHWVRYDSPRRVLYTDSELLTGSIIDNKCGWASSIAVSAMAAHRFIPDVYTVGPTQADLRAQEVARASLRQIFHYNGGFTKQQNRIKAVHIRGDHFVKATVDRNALDMLVFESPEHMQFFQNKYRADHGKDLDVISVEKGFGSKLHVVARVGQIKEVDIQATQVLVENGVEEFCDAERFAVVYYCPVSKIQQIAERYGFDPELVKPVQSFDTRTFNVAGYTYNFTLGLGTRTNDQTGYTVETNANVGKYCEFWQKLPNGTWSVAFLTGQNFEIYLGGESGFDGHNIVHFPGDKVLGQFWGRSGIADIINLNISIDKLLSHFLKSLRDGQKDYILTPKGANTKVEFSANPGPTLVTYNMMGGPPPVYVQVRSEYYQAVERTLLRMDSILNERARISEIIQGFGSDRVSTESMKILQGNATTPLMMKRQQIVEAYQRLWEAETMILRTDPAFDVTRLAANVGMGGDIAAVEFKQSDIRAGLRFFGRASLPQAQTVQELRQEAIDLMATPYFMPGPEGDETRRMVNEYVMSGGMNPVYKPEEQRAAEAQALEENELFRMAGVDPRLIMVVDNPVVDPETKETQGVNLIMVNQLTGDKIGQDWHIDPIHAEVHNKFIQDPSTSMQARMFALQHMESFHNPRMAEEEKASMENQIGMMARESVAESMGQITAAKVANEAKSDEQNGGGKPALGKSTPRQGGVNSGRSRAA
jgi:hypothetical protein